MEPMGAVTLTNCQQKALDAVKASRKHITISGPAGSGKSFLTKLLIQSLGDRLGIAICAPTHQAKIVLAKMAGLNATTIHSLFMIHPETYEDVRSFGQSKKPDLSKIRYLIIDEASMVDEDLCKIILACIPSTCQIIAIGDKSQVQPVRHEPGVLSPFFTDMETFRLVELEEIVRQQAGNPIIEVANKIRVGGWFETKWDRENKRGVLQVSGANKMIETILKKVKCPEDLLNYRLLAYTNNVVDRMNAVVRRHVYNTSEPFVDNEYLVMQQPVTKEEEVDGTMCTVVVLNNGEIVKIKPDSIQRRTMTINLPYVDTFDVEVADMVVFDSEEQEKDILVIWDSDSQIQLDSALSRAAAQYKSMGARKTRGVKGPWDYFWEVKGQFADTKSLGASTIHKSQGITLKGCGIYTGDMNFATFEIQTQLAYVAVTRATDWVLYC